MAHGEIAHSQDLTENSDFSPENSNSNLNSSSNLNSNLKKLSVIIPAYNVEKFLRKCVESVVNQTYKNIEIIIVDDGSTDSTPKICDELESEYENIKVIHQENQGLCRTRGVGVKASTGDYIAFIDSDDYIDVTAYEKVIKILEENNCDMVQFGYYFADTDGRASVPSQKPLKVKLDNTYDSLKFFFTGLTYGTCCAWNKIYKRFMLENIEWPDISMFEDACISIQTFSKAQKFMMIDNIFYYYVQRSDSIVHLSFSNSSKREDTIKASDFVIQFIEKNFPELLPEALFHPTFFSFQVIGDYLHLENKPENKKIINQFINIISNKYRRLQTELKKQDRKLDMGYNLKHSRRKKFGMWLFTYFPNLTLLSLKINLQISKFIMALKS